MFGSKEGWYAEFLAESTIALNQEDERVQLDTVITPIKQFLQDKQRPVLAYTLARSSGAPSQLAFFCEFASFSGQVMQNLGTLSDYTFDVLLTTLRPEDRTNAEVIERLTELTQGQLLTIQLAYLNQKFEQYRMDTFARYPFMSRFISANRFQKILSNEQAISRTLASNKTSLSQYLDVLAGGFTYYTVALPAIAGIATTLKEMDDTVDPSQVQWAILESCLINISLLVRTNHDIPLALFLKEQVTGDKLAWFTASVGERSDLAMGDPEIRKQIIDIRQKITDRTHADINNLSLPQRLKDTLSGLLDWAMLLPTQSVTELP